MGGVGGGGSALTLYCNQLCIVLSRINPDVTLCV